MSKNDILIKRNEEIKRAKELFANEYAKVNLNLRYRLRNIPCDEREWIINDVEKHIMRELISKYMY